MKEIIEKEENIYLNKLSKTVKCITTHLKIKEKFHHHHYNRVEIANLIK